MALLNYSIEVGLFQRKDILFTYTIFKVLSVEEKEAGIKKIVIYLKIQIFTKRIWKRHMFYCLKIHIQKYRI